MYSLSLIISLSLMPFSLLPYHPSNVSRISSFKIEIGGRKKEMYRFHFVCTRGANKKAERIHKFTRNCRHSHLVKVATMTCFVTLDFFSFSFCFEFIYFRFFCICCRHSHGCIPLLSTCRFISIRPI